MPSTQAVYCTQTSISIHTFVRYAKEVSGYEAMHWCSLLRRKTTLAFTVWAGIFFEAITDISSDTESCEEQNSASHFLIGAMAAKLWPLF